MWSRMTWRDWVRFAWWKLTERRPPRRLPDTRLEDVLAQHLAFATAANASLREELARKDAEIARLNSLLNPRRSTSCN